jgi:rhodanese-related sulfurtransferase
LSPDSCVQLTQTSFDRWGALTLALGKFVPALSTVAQPLAGAMRMPFLRYSLLSASGIALWTAVVIGAGMVFHLEVDALIARAEELGSEAVAAVAAIVAAYVAFKWWQRWRFYKALRMARITVEELREKMTAAEKPIVVDLRPPAKDARGRKSIPGAITMKPDELQLDRLRAGAEIVFVCNCPNEASAASAAKQLMRLGYGNVRPLLGGFDAWVAAGYEVEDAT